MVIGWGLPREGADVKTLATVAFVALKQNWQTGEELSVVKSRMLREDLTTDLARAWRGRWALAQGSGAP